MPVAAAAVTAMLFVVALVTLPLSAADHARWVDRLGFDLSALRSFRVWTMPAATLFEADPGLGFSFVRLLMAAGVGIALVEIRAGWRLALVAFFLSDWLASFLRLGVLALLGTLGSASADAFLHTPDTGSSAASTGAFMVAAFVYGGRTRLLLLGAIALWLLYGLLVFRLDVAIAHVAGAMAGAAIGGGWHFAGNASECTAITHPAKQAGPKQ